MTPFEVLCDIIPPNVGTKMGAFTFGTNTGAFTFCKKAYSIKILKFVNYFLKYIYLTSLKQTLIHYLFGLFKLLAHFYQLVDLFSFNKIAIPKFHTFLVLVLFSSKEQPAFMANIKQMFST